MHAVGHAAELEPNQLRQLTAKLMALRQYIEEKGVHTKREFKGAKESWKLQLVRRRIVPNVIETFGAPL